MKIEIERKRELGTARHAVEEQLQRLGYLGSSPAIEIDTYFSRPDRDFMQTVECLRVRQSTNKTEITYKPPTDTSSHNAAGIISKTELDVPLKNTGDANAARELLKIMGMRELVTVHKTRTTYRHPEHAAITVAIDEVKHAGSFVETELIVDEPQKDEAQGILSRLETELGIAELPVINLPYRDLVMATQ